METGNITERRKTITEHEFSVKLNGHSKQDKSQNGKITSKAHQKKPTKKILFVTQGKATQGSEKGSDRGPNSEREIGNTGSRGSGDKRI